MRKMKEKYLGGDGGGLGDLLELVEVLVLGVEVDAALHSVQGSLSGPPLSLGGLDSLQASLYITERDISKVTGSTSDIEQQPWCCTRGLRRFRERQEAATSRYLHVFYLKHNCKRVVRERLLV